MLIGAPAPEAIDAAIVVEDDRAAGAALGAASHLRRKGLSVEIFASGSIKKRFDRAIRKGALEIVTLTVSDGRIAHRVKSSAAPRVEAALADHRWGEAGA
jgi:histidyl-tRNA synthetase